MKDGELVNFINEHGIQSFVDYWEAIPLFSTMINLPNRIKESIREQRLSNSATGLTNSLLGMGTGSQRGSGRATQHRARASTDRRPELEPAPADGTAATPNADDETAETGSAIAAWEARVVELRQRRDRLAEDAAAREAVRRDAEHRRARAEASTLLAEERLARAERDVAALVGRERDLVEARDALRTDLAAGREREAAARRALDEVHAADVADRDRRVPRNVMRRRPASDCGPRTRGSERPTTSTSRRASVSMHCARAPSSSSPGSGSLAIDRLREISGSPTPPDALAGGAAATERGRYGRRDRPIRPVRRGRRTGGGDRGGRAHLGRHRPNRDSARSSEARALRRRFHELGAVNPFAHDEYAELKTRLDGLEAQASGHDPRHRAHT